MRKFIFLLAIFVALTQQSYSQSLKQVLKLADSTYAQKDFFNAYTAYRDALKYDSNRTDIRYKLAESARQFNSFRAAAKAYVKVLGSPERAQYPDARMRIGEMLHKLGEYKSALASYLEYIASTPEAPQALLQLAERGATDCEFAIKTLANTADQRNLELYPQAVSMGDKVNGPYTDYGASFRKDTLYHTSYEFAEPKDKYKLYNKVVRSYKGNSKELLPPSFNAPGKHTAYSVFTPDDKGVYFCNCDLINASDLRCDIYYRDLTSPGSIPIKLGINNLAFTSTSPALGKNTKGESVLYFVSNRTGGKGKLDIWMGPIQPDGNVTVAEPLSEINTPENDITPFYQELPGKANLLFFSTDGRPSFGGFDLYGTRLTNSNRWLTPYNLGGNLNSSYDEFGYVRDPKGDTLVFSSNRKGSILLEKEQEACCHDLYKAGIPKLVNLEVNTFKLRDSLALNGTSVKIFEENPDGTRKELLSKTEENSNHYTTLIERYKKYYIQAVKKGFITEDTFLLANLGEEQFTLIVDLYLPNLRLDVFTLLAQQKTPLNGCTVYLYEKTAEGKFLLLETKSDPNGNEYNYAADLGKTYLAKATKAGYSMDSLEVPMTIETIKEFGYDITIDLLLNQSRLNIDLFFDNAKPGPGNLTVTTEKYDALYDNYLKKKGEFVGYSAIALGAFFQNDVIKGFDRLREFLPSIAADLSKGLYVKVYMEGYASPLGNADYNKRLGARRMVSVINYLKVANNGVFKKYIDSGFLSFDLDALGEEKSGPDIPTALANIKDEIFGLNASLNRKVRIYKISTDTKQIK